jgi:hypothetical protein
VGSAAGWAAQNVLPHVIIKNKRTAIRVRLCFFFPPATWCCHPATKKKTNNKHFLINCHQILRCKKIWF